MATDHLAAEGTEQSEENLPLNIVRAQEQESLHRPVPALVPDHPVSARRGLGRLFSAPAADKSPLGSGWLDAISLAEGGLLADVGVVLDLASIYLPIIGTVFSPAVPTPFALLALRRGPRVTMLAAAVAMFLITIIAGPHFGWRMGLQAMVGLLLGWAMRRRLNPLSVLALGTLLVSLVTYAAALGVIFVVGLPLSDVVGELRNALDVFAGALSSVASLVGAHAQWQTIHPLYLTLENLALRFWPALLFLFILFGALPVVILYYTVANATSRVLGEQAPVFPPLWSLRAIRFAILILLAPFLAPLLAMRTLRRPTRAHANTPMDGTPHDR